MESPFFSESWSVVVDWAVVVKSRDETKGFLLMSCGQLRLGQLHRLVLSAWAL